MYIQEHSGSDNEIKDVLSTVVFQAYSTPDGPFVF